MMRRVLAAAMSAGVLAPPVGHALDLHGYVDCRFVAHAHERSWIDGGLGKTRFGDGGSAATCAQGALVVTAQPAPALLALADIQYQTSGRNEAALLEAWLRWRPVSTTPLRWSLKAGAFFPPVSLENEAIGWTSPWTLSSSAIDSWVGEELRSVGAEARLEWRGAGHTVQGFGALVRGNDPAGELMAARGWAIGDYVSGPGSRVREPDIYAIDEGAPVPLRFNPYLENDGRLGWYAGVDWNAPGRGRIALLRYDNEADPATHSRGASSVYSWHTDFWSLGAQADAGDVLFLAQAMSGSTTIAPAPDFITRTRFRAAYLLAAWNRGEWSPALRVDAFSTAQLPRSLDPRVREHGHALTFALNWRPTHGLRLTAELLQVDSWRNQRLDAGLAAQQTDRQLQLNARVLF
jgi:hypothetical protein